MPFSVRTLHYAYREGDASGETASGEAWVILSLETEHKLRVPVTRKRMWRGTDEPLMSALAQSCPSCILASEAANPLPLLDDALRETSWEAYDITSPREK